MRLLPSRRVVVVRANKMMVIFSFRNNFYKRFTTSLYGPSAVVKTVLTSSSFLIVFSLGLAVVIAVVVEEES